MKAWGDLSIAAKREMILEEYGDDGGSASAIAAKVAIRVGHNVSRNTIIGFYSKQPDLKVSHPFTGRRAGKNLRRKVAELPGNTTAPRKARIIKTKPIQTDKAVTVKPEPMPPPPPSDAEIYDANSRHVSLMELTSRCCRFAVSGEGAELKFCGHRTPVGQSWCDHHRKRVFRPIAHPNDC